MRGVPIIGNLAYVPANRRIDTDRFAAGHAERYAARNAYGIRHAIAAIGHREVLSGTDASRD
jgi:hypothetical protein